MSDERWLRRARLFGAAPLVVATLIFSAWVVTHADAWALAGLFTIFAGLASVVCGLICLAIHKRRSRQPAGWVLALLLVNFPSAAAFIYAADYLASWYTVSVVNRGSRTLDSFLVVGEDVNGQRVRLTIGPLAKGARGRQSFRLRSETTVLFDAARTGQRLCGVLDGYAYPARITAIVTDDAITVERQRGEQQKVWPGGEPCPAGPAP